MKPKQGRKGDINKSHKYDRCQTPHYALDSVIPYLNKNWFIWESAAGEGQIVFKLSQSGFRVIQSDILTGQNFFNYEPEKWDCQVTNPPYSIKYEWLKRSYELKKPFALLLPIETIGTASGQRLFKRYGFELIILNKRINFKMPEKGYTGNGAQFPVGWFTWGLNLGQQVTFVNIKRYQDYQISLI